MFRGRFDDLSGGPIIDVHLTIKNLNIDGPVEFLLDTGSDVTVLMPSDAKRLGVDFSKLTQTRTSYGVGGKAEDFIIPAVLIVNDEDETHAYRFALRIAKSIPEIEDAPSLLGRDIAKNWNISIKFPDERLEIEVVMSDESRPRIG